MKRYIVKATPKGKSQLKQYVGYLKKVKRSEQAAQALLEDFVETQQSLETVAGMLKKPDNVELQKRDLKRINLIRHNYFLLYRLNDNVVEIVNMFHGLEDYENKLEY